jgi:hypothetical protein
MSNRRALSHSFPSILRHEGAWEGVYRHMDVNGQCLDEYEARVFCEFPDEGEVVYREHATFSWADGRSASHDVPAYLREEKLWWDMPAFHGYAWEAGNGVILLASEREDEPGATFLEAIVLAPGGQTRARTWHWFKDGVLYRRTLCDEARA